MVNFFKKIIPKLRFLKRIAKFLMNHKRVSLGKKYLLGEGIEIGALHNPLKLASEKAKVRYMDHFPEDELRAHYPELNGHKFYVDFVDNGESLKTVSENSIDFIIANHMIEHCRDPIGTIYNHLTKLKTGGILYYAIPDKRYTFDSKRELTTFQHLVGDYRGMNDDFPHFKEWVQFSESSGLTENLEIEKRSRLLMDSQYSIHYHVWTAQSFKDFLTELASFPGGKRFQLICLKRNFVEFIAVLKKL